MVIFFYFLIQLMDYFICKTKIKIQVFSLFEVRIQILKVPATQKDYISSHNHIIRFMLQQAPNGSTLAATRNLMKARVFHTDPNENGDQFVLLLKIHFQFSKCSRKYTKHTFASTSFLSAHILGEILIPLISGACIHTK